MGDGLMALFGRETNAGTGCRDALAAAKKINRALVHFNRELESELAQPLQIGMGLHVGPLVMGRIGYGRNAPITVIGATVNAASRLESLSKEQNCQLVLSIDAARYAGIDTSPYRRERVTVRGFTEPMEVACIESAEQLAAVG